MSKNKWICAILATLLAASSLTGCGKSASSSKTESGKEQSSTAQEEKLEPYVLDMYYPNYGSPLNDLEAVQTEMSKVLTEKMNATIALHPLDSGAWGDKVNLMLTSNDKIDIISSSIGLTPLYATAATKGSYTALNELLDQYGKNLVKEVGMDFIKGTMVNGKIYGIPVLKEKGVAYGYLFNQALVEKYQFDLSTIKTYRDVEPMLQTIHEKEEGVTPLCFSARNMKPFVNLEIEDVAGVGGLPLNSTDLKLVDTYTYAPVRKILDWGRAMYEKGYINKSSLTDTDEGPMKAGNAFCMPYELKPGKDGEMSTAWGFEVSQVVLGKAYMPSTQAQGIMMSIGKTSKDPARAMQFLDLLYTDKDFINLLVYGIEGKNYVKVSENSIDYPEGVDSKSVGYANQGWLFGNQFNNYLMKNEDPEKWNKFKAFNESVIISPVLGFVFDPSNVSTELAALATIEKQYVIPLLTGSVEVESTITELMEKYKAAGYDVAFKEAQDQIDKWAAGNQ